jgi:hypothetical protein|eukprot:COSAG01_NODE_19156_length_1027_cov_1.529095_1_plen_147_part_00
MERCSSAALSWITGLNPGVISSAASNSDQSARLQAASMVIHARKPGTDVGHPFDAPFVRPWSAHWWSGGASCAHMQTAVSQGVDAFAASPLVMSIVNGLQPTGRGGEWTVGFTETYILHDGAMLQGIVANSDLLDHIIPTTAQKAV